MARSLSYAHAVSSDLSLFGDDEPEEHIEPAPPAQPQLASWLVDSLRKALTARGLTTMTERQEAIESLAGRPVDGLTSLSRAEAMRILAELTPQSASQTGASSWDDRDEDTWIDRL